MNRFLRNNGLEIIVVTLLFGCFATIGGALYFDHQRKHSPAAYEAWCKIHRRTDLAYDEWKFARKAGLLDSPNDVMLMPIVTR